MSLAGLLAANGTGDWLTQFPYLRASVFQRLRTFDIDLFGISDVEYQQADALGGAWGLTCNWGDKNRLEGQHHWHDDDSWITTDGDRSGYSCLVSDPRGIPQYALELIYTASGNFLLPYRYLKRPGYQGARRVFFPPEDDIAIWYVQQPNANTKNIILTANPGPLREWNGISDTIVGCLPAVLLPSRKPKFPHSATESAGFQFLI